MARRREDIHRPGAIVPADYKLVLSYAQATTVEGWPQPSFRINCELDGRRTGEDGKVVNGEHSPDGRCCVVGLIHRAKVKWAGSGATGRCSVCGSHFVYGDVWEHTPTGEHIHIGHICAEKYELLASRVEIESWRGEQKRLRAVEIERRLKQERRDAFLADHPGLEEALQADHHILHDLAAKFSAYGQLSDKQVALAFRLAGEAKSAHLKEAAPAGRVDLVGQVVSVRARGEDRFDRPIWKMVVQVGGELGWRCWSTVPASIKQMLPRRKGDGPDFNLDRWLQGKTVSMRATIKPSRDDRSFAFASRPSNARVVVEGGAGC